MATVADALRHLIGHAPGLSDTNRAEFLDAVSSEYGAPDVSAEQADADAAAARAANAARIAELQAELGKAQAELAADDEDLAARQPPDPPPGSAGISPAATTTAPATSPESATDTGIAG